MLHLCRIINNRLMDLNIQDRGHVHCPRTPPRCSHIVAMIIGIPVCLCTCVHSPLGLIPPYSSRKYISSYSALASSLLSFRGTSSCRISKLRPKYIPTEWETPTLKEVKPSPSGRETSGPQQHLGWRNCQDQDHPAVERDEEQEQVQEHLTQTQPTNQTKPLNHVLLKQRSLSQIL